MPSYLPVTQANALREWLRGLKRLNPSLPWPSDQQLDKIQPHQLPEVPQEILEPALFNQRAELDDQAHDNLDVMIKKADTILQWIEPEWSRSDRTRFFDEAFRSFGLLDEDITDEHAKNICGYEPPPGRKSTKSKKRG